MRLLIDNALSPALADLLRNAGHGAVHVREVGLHHADDKEFYKVVRKRGLEPLRYCYRQPLKLAGY